jgi:hypothetical protein
MQEQTIINRQGKKLSSILHVPKKSTNKIIIISHSFKADKDYDRIGVNFAKKACTEGYAVLRFDFYGSGKSDGKFEDSDVISQKQDLEDVIKFVQDKGYTQIALAGLSQGAAMSVLVYNPKIKVLILWSPAFDVKVLYDRYKKYFEKANFLLRSRIRDKIKVKIGKKMWQSFGKIKVFEKIPTIKAPTLVVAASKDSLHMNNITKYFKKLNCEKKLEIIQDADHDFLDLNKEKQAISISLDFVKKYF